MSRKFLFLGSIASLACLAAADASAAAGGSPSAGSGGDSGTSSKTAPAKATKPRTAAAAGTTASAPIPDAVARGDQPEAEKAGKGPKEIADLAALGKAFTKTIPDEARSGTYRPKGDDDWIGTPVALADGWHHDPATKWNFLVRDNRLFEAKSDDAMANQPSGTHGRALRA